jgi:hypothetical protein
MPCALLAYVRSALTYALLFFGLSGLAVIATAEGLPPADVAFSEPGSVTRADTWPVSKNRHMQEGDFWHWVEEQYAQLQSDPDHWLH